MTAIADLRQRTVRSLGWQLLGTGGQRVVSFLGLAATARLLSKPDIGLFGIVLAGIAAIEALTAFTGEQSQIHSKHGSERRFLDTVFTVRLVRAVLIGSVLAALAPAMAWFFSSPEHDQRYWLPGLFLLLSANGLCDAIQNPARAAAIKQLDFRRVALADFAAALAGTGLQICLAYAWRDVWALVVGQLAATTIRSLASYTVAPYFPRLRIEREAFREVMRYSLRGAGTPFLLMMIAQAPALILGKTHEAAVLAIYAYCDRLSRVPEEMCLRVIAPVAIPAYAQLVGQPDRLASAWLRSIRTVLLLGIPGTVAMCWLGNALPAIAFGADFGSIAWLFPLLALRGGIAGTNSVIGPLFWAIGEPQKDRAVQFVRAGLLYLIGIPMALQFGASGLAAAKVATMSAALMLSLHFALRRLELPLRALGSAASAGLQAGAVLALMLAVTDLVGDLEGLSRLAAGATLGGMMLTAVVLRSGLLRRAG